MDSRSRGQTWTESHKRACLIRWVMRLQKEARQTFYETWARRHGKASTLVLIEEVKQAHRSTSAS